MTRCAASAIISPVSTVRSYRSDHVLGQSGFAVVTALLVLVAVGVLAAGSAFLTLTNLRLGENTRTQAVARYNAETWLDLTLLVIADRLVDLDRYPTEAELEPFLVPSSEYAVTRYSFSGDVGEVQVTGFALRGDAGAEVARHPVAARFEVARSASTETGPGFVTPGDIEVNGRTTVFLNMHAGKNLKIAGNPDLGVPEDPAVISFFSLISGNEKDPFNAEKYLYDCSIGNKIECNRGDPPVVEPFIWGDVYLDAMADFCGEGTEFEEPALDRRGNVIERVIPNVPQGSVLCLADGDFVFTGGDLRNVTIVGGPNTRVKLTSGSSGTVGDPLGVRVIAGDVELAPEGQGNNAVNNPLQGENLIYARANVNINKGATNDRTETVEVDGIQVTRYYADTQIRAGQDVVYQGAGGRGLYASILTNRKFCLTGGGGGDFVGTITAVATGIKVNDPPTQIDSCGDNRADIYWGGSGNNVIRIPFNADQLINLPPTPTGLTILQRRP